MLNMKISFERFEELFKYDASEIIPDEVIAEYFIETDKASHEFFRVSKVQLLNNPITSGRPFYAVLFFNERMLNRRGRVMAGFTTRKEALSFAKYSRDVFIEQDLHESGYSSNDILLLS